MRRKTPKLMTVRTCMKRLMVTENEQVMITNSQRSTSWHLLIAQRAKKGYVKHYLRGVE